jgi:hypothetical protein
MKQVSYAIRGMFAAMAVYGMYLAAAATWTTMFEQREAKIIIYLALVNAVVDAVMAALYGKLFWWERRG